MLVLIKTTKINQPNFPLIIFHAYKQQNNAKIIRKGEFYEKKKFSQKEI